MLKHGGRFENYFSRHTVTHIICSNLPDSKIKNLRFAFLLTTYTIHFYTSICLCISETSSFYCRSFSGELPVVKPTWILDSVASNKLLSCKLLWTTLCCYGFILPLYTVFIHDLVLKFAQVLVLLYSFCSGK